LRWLFVSARNASFTYEGSAVDSRQVGRELGVRYVLEGSVRRSNGRVRANALLSDAATGLQVWAESYDVGVPGFFELQDQISKSVTAAVEPRLLQHEHERFRSRPPESLDAWGYVMQAMPYIWTWGSATDIDAAQQLLSKALLIDPDYSRANSFLAWTNAARVQLGWAPDHNVLTTALAMAQRAVAQDPEDPWPHCALGYVYMVSRGFDRAVEELTEAIELNPSFTLAHVILGCAYGYGGMPNDGLHHLGIARHLSPRDFAQAANFATRGLCCFVAGRFSDGVALAARAVELRPHFGSAWRTLAAAAGKAGDLAMASRALGEARRLHPGLCIDWVEKWHPIVHTRDRAIYIDGLRAAGLT
jgi:adenylate cyclase